MANITKFLTNIKNAIYGKDVRDSIHDGIEAINNDVEEFEESTSETVDNTVARQDALEAKYDEQIKNLAATEVQSAEIVDARDGFSTLGEIMRKKIYYFSNVESMKSCTYLLARNCSTNTRLL